MKNNILKIVLIFVCAFVLSLSSFFIITENEVYAEDQTTTTLINDEETESKLI